MLVKALAAGAIGLALGLCGERVDPRRPAVRRRHDRAVARRRQGGPLDADPYTRAALERSGEIPLALGEGLQLDARVDSAGRALDRALSLSSSDRGRRRRATGR